MLSALVRDGGYYAANHHEIITSSLSSDKLVVGSIYKIYAQHNTARAPVIVEYNGHNDYYYKFTVLDPGGLESGYFKVGSVFYPPSTTYHLITELGA